MNRLQIITLYFLSINLLPIQSQTAFANDSLTLGQAFVNLSLTAEYFDSIGLKRISNIISFEKSELGSIQNSILKRSQLYDFSYSLWHSVNAKYLFTTNKNPERKSLLTWKKNLDKAIRYFNRVHTVPIDSDNFLYEFVEFTSESVDPQRSRVEKLKTKSAPYFNRDIYPDFKRIFLTAINDGRYNFDSLKYYCNLYNIALDFDILKRAANPQILEIVTLWTDDYNPISFDKDLALALELISRYMQLDSIANREHRDVDAEFIQDAYKDFVYDLQPAKAHFRYDNKMIKKDSFFMTYLNKHACKILNKKLQRLYPTGKDPAYFTEVGNLQVSNLEEIVKAEKYYFPVPAPFPTDKVAIKNFKPKLKTLKDVDGHIKKAFDDAGYQGRLHYYYIEEPGFAVSTDIERINKDGSPAAGNKRWDLISGNAEEFSLFSIFKAMFFRTESDYRSIVCIVSAKEIVTTTERFSLAKMADILEKSYSSLPADLEPVMLKNKAITLLLYHYTQHDIGKVPMLNQNTILTVYDHLNKTSPLSHLILTNHD